MKDARKKVVFSAGTRQGGGEFAIGKRAAKRTDSAEQPEENDREPRGQIADLEMQAREDSGADHVKPGVDPHEFQPTPRDLQIVGTAELILISSHHMADMKSSHRNSAFKPATGMCGRTTRTSRPETAGSLWRSGGSFES